MPAYGAPNAVGYNLDSDRPPPPSLGRQVAGVGIGAVGGRSLWRAARPNAAGIIDRAEKRIPDLDKKIAREQGKKYVSHHNIANWEREKVRAADQAKIVRSKVGRTTKPMYRMKRAAIGAGLVATAAAVYPKRKKPAAPPPMPMPPVTGGQ